MRYYLIRILNTDGTLFATYTSHVNGQPDPGALQVEWDIPVTTLATPIGAASIKIWGVSLQTIGQSSDFNGKLIEVYGGMQAGLPLANPAQAGLLVRGVIWQAFGNWVMTNQWVEFVVVTDGGLLDQAQNIVISWTKGTPLADAIRQTLAVAVPTYALNINISPNLVLSETATGHYTSMVQFAQAVKSVSAAILGNGYQGVDVLISQDTFTVFDGSSPSTPKTISYLDLIGQPTWVDPATIQVTVVTRADLQPSDYITLPTTQVTTTAASLSQYRDKSVFQGTFIINEMRHLGNSRQPDALSWVTAINCSPTGSVAA